MASPDTNDKAESGSALADPIPTRFQVFGILSNAKETIEIIWNSGEIDGIIEKLDGTRQFYWFGRGDKWQSSCRASTVMPKTNYQWWENHKPTIW